MTGLQGKTGSGIPCRCSGPGRRRAPPPRSLPRTSSSSGPKTHWTTSSEGTSRLWQSGKRRASAGDRRNGEAQPGGAELQGSTASDAPAPPWADAVGRIRTGRGLIDGTSERYKKQSVTSWGCEIGARHFNVGKHQGRITGGSTVPPSWLHRTKHNLQTYGGGPGDNLYTNYTGHHPHSCLPRNLATDQEFVGSTVFFDKHNSNWYRIGVSDFIDHKPRHSPQRIEIPEGYKERRIQFRLGIYLRKTRRQVGDTACESRRWKQKAQDIRQSYPLANKRREGGD